MFNRRTIDALLSCIAELLGECVCGEAVGPAAVAYYSARQDPANQVNEDVQIAADYIGTKTAIGPSGLMASSTLTARKVTMAGERYPDGPSRRAMLPSHRPASLQDVQSAQLGHPVLPSAQPAAAQPTHACHQRIWHPQRSSLQEQL